MQSERRRMVREVVVQVEEESMEHVLQEGPHNIAKEEAEYGLDDGRVRNGGHRDELQWRNGIRKEGREGVVSKGKLQDSAKEKIRGNGEPYCGYDIPGRLREDLQKRQQSGDFESAVKIVPQDTVDQRAKQTR